MTFNPLSLILSILKNSPTPKAINANAISDIKSIPSTTLSGIKSKQYGPITMPITIYAVTFGNFKSLVILVIKKPKKSIKETDIITTEVEELPPSLSYKLFNNFSPFIDLTITKIKTANYFSYIYKLLFKKYNMFDILS